MLVNATVHAALPVVDLARARKFYEEKLGLKVVRTDPSPGVMLQAGGGTTLYIYQRGATKADHTVASFEVDDVEAEIKDLKAKGVVFEEYDTPETKTVNSIATKDRVKSAWFKDTEGNIIAVASM